MILDLLYNFGGWNVKIFSYLNLSLNSLLPIWVFKFISFFFDISLFALYYFLILFYFYYEIKKIPAGTDRKKKFWTLYQKSIKLGIAYACFGLAYAALKFSVNFPRPFCSLPEGSFKGLSDYGSYRCLSSFPSSHAGLAFFLAYFAWGYRSLKGKILLCSLACAVCASRIATALHYPADIAYGLFLSYAVIRIGDFAYRIFYPNIFSMLGKIPLKFFFRS